MKNTEQIAFPKNHFQACVHLLLLPECTQIFKLNCWLQWRCHLWIFAFPSSSFSFLLAFGPIKRNYKSSWLLFWKYFKILCSVKSRTNKIRFSMDLCPSIPAPSLSHRLAQSCSAGSGICPVAVPKPWLHVARRLSNEAYNDLMTEMCHFSFLHLC